MGQIILLRHGQASFGAADYDDLSEVGREQSRLAGRALAARALRDPIVAHGSLRRQRDTALLAMPAMGVADPPILDPRLDEYDHIGMVVEEVERTGAARPADSEGFQQVLDGALARWIARDEPDGWRRFQDDAVAAVASLAEAAGRGRDAVLATSGGVIAAVVAHLLHAGADTVVALNRVTVNASFTTLLAGRSGLNLLTFNDHAHLAGDRSGLRTYR